MPSGKTWWLERRHGGSYLCSWSKEWHFRWSRGKPKKVWVFIHISVHPMYGFASDLSGQRWLLCPSSFWVWTVHWTSCRFIPPTTGDCVRSLWLAAFIKPLPAVHSRLIPWTLWPSGWLWVLSARISHNKLPEPILFRKVHANMAECKEIKALFSFHAPVLQYLAYSLHFVLTGHCVPIAIQQHQTEWYSYGFHWIPAAWSECHRLGQQWQSRSLAFSLVSFFTVLLEVILK